MARAAARLGACAPALAILFAIALAPAGAAAQSGQPALSRGVDSVLNDTLSSPDDQAAGPRAAAPVIPHHSRLGPFEQCGGELGLCNSTTIGVPCGDHPWDPVALPCPDGYKCKRQSNSFWQCAPILGKKDDANAGPTRFSTAPPGAAAGAATDPAAAAGGRSSTPERVVPVANTSVPLAAADDAGGDKNATPEVKACKPGEFSVGSRCFRGSLPNGNHSSGAGAGLAGALHSRPLLLAAWQVAAVLLAMSVALLQ